MIMKQYIRVYWKLFFLNVTSLTAYRSGLISNLISSTVWALFPFISIFLLTANTPVLFGWRREEVIFLSTMYAVYYGVFQMVFAKNFLRLAVLINTGEIESFFLKPIDGQFLVSVSRVGVTAFVRVIIGIGFGYFFGKQLGISVSFIDGILLLIALFCSLMLLYAVWMNILLFLIWNPKLSNLVEVLFTISGMARYPSNMYRMVNETLMYVLLPLSLTTVVPVKILFHNISWQDYFLLGGVSIVLCGIARLFWLFAMRFYTSSSS